MFSHVIGTKLNTTVENYYNLPLLLHVSAVLDNAMYTLWTDNVFLRAVK